MKTRFLFPYWCRYLGYGLILAHIPVALFKKMQWDTNHGISAGVFDNNHVFFISTTLLMAIGLFLVAFAKEKVEDEQISQLRLDSLQWAIYLNYLILVISLVLTDDTMHILLLNLWVPLLFLIIRFRWKIYQLNRLLRRDGDLR